MQSQVEERKAMGQTSKEFLNLWYDIDLDPYSGVVEYEWLEYQQLSLLEAESEEQHGLQYSEQA